MPSVLKLEFLNASFQGQRVPFKEGLTIGSGPTCKVRAQHPEIKPVHLRCFYDNGVPMVEIGQQDAHLYLNGEDVVRSEVRHGDKLRVGPIKMQLVDEKVETRAHQRIDQLLEVAEQVAEQEEVHDFAKEDLFYLIGKDQKLRQRINFVIPSRDKFIDQAQSFLARLVKHANAEEEQVDAFMTCAKELILNAHRHGHKYDETKFVILRYRNDKDELRLTIEDQGTGFDHKKILDAVREKDAAQAARERYQAGGFGGLGFQLICKLTKELTYNKKGNVVTFVVAKKAPA